MKLTVEASLDVDKNRKLWLSVYSGEVEVDEVEEVVASMAGALVDQVTKAEAIIRPGLEGKPKEPAMPRTFQEDDD